MYEEQLTKIGLTKDQVLIYEYLVQHGASQASFITRQVPLSRPLVYKILGELETLGLVEKKEEPGKISVFHPSHPSVLATILQSKKSALEDSEQALNGVLDKLVSEYNLHAGKPGIRFFVGIDGLRKIYQDILKTNKDFYFIRPKFETTFNEQMAPIVKEFIASRVRKNIHVTALTPTDITPLDTKKDVSLLLTRVWVPLEFYNSPVEVNIYGDKVAILSYSQELIGVMIESPQIAESMRQIFVLASKGASHTNSSDHPEAVQNESA